VAGAAVMRSDERHLPQSDTSNSIWDGLDAHARIILDGHGGEGVVAVRPSLVRALRGTGNAAILLSQLLYWSRRLSDREGWFYQTQRRLEAQTGLGADAQRTATRLLVRLGILETRLRSAPATLHYRVRLEQLADLLLHHARAASVADHSPQLDVEYCRQLETDHGPLQDTGDGRSLAAGHGPPHKENIQESREERLASSAPLADGVSVSGTTHAHLESPIDRAIAISSMPTVVQASGGASTSGTTARRSGVGESAAGNRPVAEAPPCIAATPRRTASRRRPPSSIPEDFVVTAAMHAWARERVSAINLARETEKFVNHAHAHDRRQVDWEAAWRNWMLKAQEFAEEAHPPASRGSVVL
jgi:hypothetical protein